MKCESYVAQMTLPYPHKSAELEYAIVNHTLCKTLIFLVTKKVFFAQLQRNCNKNVFIQITHST